VYRSVINIKVALAYDIQLYLLFVPLKLGVVQQISRIEKKKKKKKKKRRVKNYQNFHLFAGLSSRLIDVQQVT
jgi:hypothetical protein